MAQTPQQVIGPCLDKIVDGASGRKYSKLKSDAKASGFVSNVAGSTLNVEVCAIYCASGKLPMHSSLHTQALLCAVQDLSARLDSLLQPHRQSAGPAAQVEEPQDGTMDTLDRYIHAILTVDQEEVVHVRLQLDAVPASVPSQNPPAPATASSKADGHGLKPESAQGIAAACLSLLAPILLDRTFGFASAC